MELVDFTKCGECAATALEPGSFNLLRTALNLGELEFEGIELLVKCGGFLHCVYGGTPKLHVEGSAEGELAAIYAEGAELKKLEGATCPSTAKWSATYSILLPDPIYIST